MRRTTLMLMAVLASLYWHPSTSFAAAQFQFESGEVDVSFSGPSTTTGPCPSGIASQTFDVDYLVEPAQAEGGVLHLDLCFTAGYNIVATFIITTDEGETLSGTAEGRVIRDDVPGPIELTLTVQEGTGRLRNYRGSLALDASWSFGDWSPTGGHIDGTITGTLTPNPK